MQHRALIGRSGATLPVREPRALLEIRETRRAVRMVRSFDGSRFRRQDFQVDSFQSVQIHNDLTLALKSCQAKGNLSEPTSLLIFSPRHHKLVPPLLVSCDNPDECIYTDVLFEHANI